MRCHFLFLTIFTVFSTNILKWNYINIYIYEYILKTVISACMGTKNITSLVGGEIQRNGGPLNEHLQCERVLNLVTLLSL
jgi:hypothetical protein